MKRLLFLAALLGGCAEGVYPPPGLPESCAPEDRACYTNPIDGREMALRCGMGEISGAVWIVDHVCAEDAACVSGDCAPVPPLADALGGE